MAQYQPAPRYWQTAAQIGHKTFLWGGRTQDFTARGRQMLASSIQTFDTFHEKWEQKGTTGLAPPGLYQGVCTTVSESLYHFGGYDGHSNHNSLHCLNCVTLEWTQVHSLTPGNQPMPKSHCGMVTYHEEADGVTSLAVFAGFGKPITPTQPGSSFVKVLPNGRGWTNELHLFNLTNGEWTSPPTTGPRPPPCSAFSFTAINHHKAVMFGGCQPGHLVNDIYIIDFHSMVWTKLERPEGATWPVERSYAHAATCLNYGDDHPQLLVTGGLDKKNQVLNDAWLLDINTGRWRELTLPEGTLPRWGHTVTSYQVDQRRIHATTFGGCPDFNPSRSDDDHLKLADTTVMEFESVQSSSSGGTPTIEWVLKDVIGSQGLGTPERLKRLKEMRQRKTEHELLYLPPAAAEPGFPTQLPAIQRTLPHLYQSTTLPVYEPTFQYSPAQFPVPPTAPTLQQQYSSGGFQEMLQEQLPTIPPIEPSLPPYYAPSLPPLPAILPPEVQPDVSSTAAYHVEASTVAAPFDQPSIFSGPLHTLLTTVSATSPYTTYIDTPPQESPLPKSASQTADIKPKVKQFSPKEKKPSPADIKPKMEFSPKKDPEDGTIEAEIAVKLKQEFRDIETSGPIEELALENKVLRVIITQRDEKIAEQAKQIAEQIKQASEKELQLHGDFPSPTGTKDGHPSTKSEFHPTLKHSVITHGEMTTVTDVYKAAGVIAGKRKQLEPSEQGMVLKKQRLSDEASGESAVEVGRKGKPGIGEADNSLKVQIKKLEAENEELKRQLSQKNSRTSYNSLLGVEVVGEEEVVVTNEAMSFHWKEYGFKLHVPEDALPEGTPEYHVNIKASLSGQFELPEGYELVSAVYWVATPGKFTKPVTIEAQHCANFSNPSQLCFVRTNCTQKSLPYKFKVVDGGSFTCGSKYGVLSAPHFSGNGIAKEVTPGEHSCQYCAQVYFTAKLRDYWYCHFVITKDLEMCLTVVKRKYQQEYDIAPPITFDGDHVALEIPDDGIHTDSGWDIVPLQKARIKKAQVDNFSSEKSWVPECVLLLKWLQKDRSPDPLEYKIKLLGTGEENDFFRVFHHPDSWPSTLAETPHMKHPAAVKDLQVELAIHDLLEVTEYLLNLKQTDIYYLGLTLGLTHPHLKTMERSSTFRENMIAAWLQKEDDVTRRGLPTWETLVKALRNDRVNQNGVADKIVTDKNVFI